MNKKTVLTPEGRDKLEQELKLLKTVTRKEVAERLKVARSYGDLSENSEYDEAKNEQAKVEARIMEVEAILANVKLIDKTSLVHDRVSVGSHIRVLDIEFNEEMTLYIVGSSESDPDNGRISDESPVGAALIDKEVGDIAEADAPEGVIKFKVLEILPQ